MNETDLLLLLFGLLIKHAACDGPFQTAYMALNKGCYGHPGGIGHAAVHTAGTYLVVVTFFDGRMAASEAVILAMSVSILDGLIHYHIDWAKERLSSWMKLSSNETSDEGLRVVITDARWFQALVIDQALHMATYLAIAGLLLKGFSS